MSIEKVIVKESTILNLDSSLLENISGYKLNIVPRAIGTVGSVIGGVGNDTLRIASSNTLLSGGLSEGNNKIDIRATGVEVDFTAGNGNNSIKSKADDVDVTFTSGAGNDSVSSIADDFNGDLNLGDGANKVSLKGSNSTLNLVTGSGNDKISIKGDGFTSINGLNLGDGANKVSLKGDGADTSIITGDGDDEISLKVDSFGNKSAVDPMFNPPNLVESGIGNDKVSIKGNDFYGVIDLGAGTDSLKFKGDDSLLWVISQGDADKLDIIGAQLEADISLEGSGATINFKGDNLIVEVDDTGNFNTINVTGSNADISMMGVSTSYINGSEAKIEANFVDSLSVRSGAILDLDNSFVNASRKSDIIEVSRASSSTISLGKGNDSIILDNTQDLIVDGGFGTDSWLIQEDVDLSQLNNLELVNFESIQLMDGSRLKLTTDDFDLMGSSNKSFRISGDLGTVDTGLQEWLVATDINVGKEIYKVYTNGEYRLEIQDSLAADVIVTDTNKALEAPEARVVDLANLPTVTANGDFFSSVHSVGDINADGINDIFLGTYAENYDRGGYIIFGGEFKDDLDLANLTSDEGFSLYLDGNRNLYLESQLFDFNGDGINDLAVTTRNPYETYIVFGSSSLDSVNLNDLSSDDYLSIKSSIGNGIFADFGDFNGDGRDDILMDSVVFKYPPSINGVSHKLYDVEESAYLIDSTTSYESYFDLEINGSLVSEDYSFESLQIHGTLDFNGDGTEEFVSLSNDDDSSNSEWTMEVNVVSNIDTNLLLDEENTLKISGLIVDDYGYIEVKNLGDFNGDDKEDILISGTRDSLGYVIFGSEMVPEIDVDTMTAEQGLEINNVKPNYYNDSVNVEFLPAGDLNGDNYDDILATSVNLDYDVLRAHLIFGGPNVTNQNFDLNVNEDNVVKIWDITWIHGYDMDSSNVAINRIWDPKVSIDFDWFEPIGDINNDGFADLALQKSGKGEINDSVHILHGSESFADIIGIDGTNYIYDGDDISDSVRTLFESQSPIDTTVLEATNHIFA